MIINIAIKIYGCRHEHKDYNQVAALLGGAIAMLLLPETRGKTFAELEVSLFISSSLSLSQVIFTGEMDTSMEVGKPKPKQFQSDSPGKISV